jgi:hypothetical protein
LSVAIFQESLVGLTRAAVELNRSPKLISFLVGKYGIRTLRIGPTKALTSAEYRRLKEALDVYDAQPAGQRWKWLKETG